MPQCPKCRDMVTPGETYCPNCGATVPPEPETPDDSALLQLFQPVNQPPVYPQPAVVQPQFFQPPAPQPEYPLRAPETPAEKAPQPGCALAVLGFVFATVSTCGMLVLLRAFLREPVFSDDSFFITGQLTAQGLVAAVGLTFSSIALCRNTEGQLPALLGMSFSLAVIAAFLAAVLI